VGVWTLPRTPAGRSGSRACPRGTGTPGPAHAPRRTPRPSRLFALAEVTEGGVDTWGVLYLRNHLARAFSSERVPTSSASRGGDARGCAASLWGASPPDGDCSSAAACRRGDPPRVASPRCRGRPPWGWRSVRARLPLLALDEQRQPAGQPGGQCRRNFTAAATSAGWRGPIVGWVSQAYGPSVGCSLLAAAAFAVAIVSFVGPNGVANLVARSSLGTP